MLGRFKKKRGQSPNDGDTKAKTPDGVDCLDDDMFDSEGGDKPKVPEADDAALSVESLEARILLSATWLDLEADNDDGDSSAKDSAAKADQLLEAIDAEDDLFGDDEFADDEFEGDEDLDLDLSAEDEGGLKTVVMTDGTESEINQATRATQPNDKQDSASGNSDDGDSQKTVTVTKGAPPPQSFSVSADDAAEVNDAKGDVDQVVKAEIPTADDDAAVAMKDAGVADADPGQGGDGLHGGRLRRR